MKTPNAKVKSKPTRIWIRRTLITVAILVLLPITLFTIGWLNRDTVLDVIQEWYSENNSGTLEIGSVNASFISGFPNVGFTLKEIKQTDTDTLTDKFSEVLIEEAKLVIGAANLLSGDIKFEKIQIKNAIVFSEVRSTRSKDYHQQLKIDAQKEIKKGFALPSWINNKKASIKIQDLKFLSKDSILNKYFNLDIHTLQLAYKEDQANLTGEASFNVTANNLGFNTNKGSFLNGARVIGNPTFTFKKKDDLIFLPNFLLKIDKQNFEVEANFDLTETKSYTFNLENEQTDFDAIKRLLPDSISTKLVNYNIEKPFKTSLSLIGQFAYGNNPNIEATFSSKDNSIVIADRIKMENATFNGTLTNDIYAQLPLLAYKKSRKDIKVNFENLSATIDDIELTVSDSYFQSSPDSLNYIQANLEMNGSNESLAALIDMENFEFIGGQFQLNAKIDGDVSNPHQFLNKSIGDFRLSNTEVKLRKNGLQLPIENIDITLDNDISLLEQLRVNLPNGSSLNFKGQLKNISGLLSKDPKNMTTSRIALDSRLLNINQLIAMANRFVPKSTTDVEDRKNLHQTLEAIYTQFNPQFILNLGELQYNDVDIKKVKANLNLVTSEKIVLNNFAFNYGEAQTTLSGTVVVPEPRSNLKAPIIINASANSNGPIKIFKDLFNIKLFEIDKGEYSFKGSVNGNINRLSQLLENAGGDLNLTNTLLYYPPADLDVEFDSLALFVDNGHILLNKFDVEIGENSPIKLTGKIEDFPGFLLDSREKNGTITLNIDAPYLDGDKILETINAFGEDNEEKRKEKGAELHQVFRDIYEFSPLINISVDSLKYQDLITSNLKSNIYFENDSILKLNHLDITYKNTNASITGTVNAHDSRKALRNDNPFQFDFSIDIDGETADLNDYLKTTNFFFRSGSFNFNAKYNGQSQALSVLNSNAYGELKISDAVVDNNSADLRIPIDSLYIEIDNNLATLKKLDVNLPGKSSVEFSGTINDFSSFINNTGEFELHKSDFDIYAPYLDTDDLKSFLASSKKDEIQKDSSNFNLKRFKSAMVDINESFYPTVSIKIDSLRHKDFDIANFNSDLLFDKEGDFIMDSTELNFYDGSITISTDIGVAYENQTPVEIKMIAENIDLNELVTRFNYFKDKDLKNTDKIDGNLSFEIDAKGSLDNSGKIDANSLNGTFKINLEEFLLYNYKPIMENSVMLKDERFKNLEFRPITQTFTVKNGHIIIPRTEIQSSAIQVFVEGKLKIDEYVDIWMSVPWKNLKRNDGLDLPEKTTFKNAGSKFYINLVQDKTSDKPRKQKLRTKIRLGNRKLKKSKIGF